MVADAVWAAEYDGFVSTAVCEDYYASIKLHLKELIGQLVCARLDME